MLKRITIWITKTYDQLTQTSRALFSMIENKVCINLSDLYRYRLPE
jgi:hypothetical protein